MGRVGPNSKSFVNGIVASGSGDLGVSSDVVLSSVRPVGSKLVPVEADEEGLPGPPPKRPLILSRRAAQQESPSEPIPSLTFNGILLDLADSDGVAIVVLISGPRTHLSVRLARASAELQILASKIP